jgi:3-hydroxyacyl-CoA dehydrogenase
MTAMKALGVRALDTVGFILDHVAMGRANEGARLAEEGISTADVDTTLEQRLGDKIRALRTVDLSSVHTVARSLWVLYDGLDEHYRHCRLLVQMPRTTHVSSRSRSPARSRRSPLTVLDQRVRAFPAWSCS